VHFSYQPNGPKMVSCHPQRWARKSNQAKTVTEGILHFNPHHIIIGVALLLVEMHSPSIAKWKLSCWYDSIDNHKLFILKLVYESINNEVLICVNRSCMHVFV